MSIADKQRDIVEEMGLFQSWEDRYEYVLGLGKRLPRLAKDDRKPEDLVKGCQSELWLSAELDLDGKVHFQAYSESAVAMGMIALFVRVLDGETPDAILTADLSFINQTELKEHLAPTRANSLAQMPAQLKQRALKFATPL